MPPPSAYPKDEKGQFVTLSMLKELENGDVSEIREIKGPQEKHVVPENIVQSGPDANCESFDMRFHFNRQREIFVWFTRHDDGKRFQQSLDNLKQRGFSVVHNQVSILPFKVIAELVRDTNYALTKITGDYGHGITVLSIQPFQEILMKGIQF